MRRHLVALACAALAAALTAAPAAAQHPGRNGAKAYGSNGSDLTAPCLQGAPAGDGWTPSTIVAPDDMAFSASGRYLAISGSRLDDEGLFLVDVENCHPPRRIGPRAAGVSWSPDGRQLAVERDGDILVISSRTGATLRNLTPNTPGSQEESPSWHPRGGTIAYTAADGVRSVPATGGRSRLLARDAHAPEYSPDGRTIAYISWATSRITTADAATGRSARASRISAWDFTWSPDGRSYLFVGTDDVDCIVATTGGRVVERLHAGEPCTEPAWQPRRR